jgi:hypothetical protein
MNSVILDILRSDPSKQYGAAKSFALTSSTLTRTRAAFGKLYTPTVGGTVGANDFELLEPWSKCRLCNLSDAGVVNAYQGDVGFVLDGTNGQVMVEIPKFFYRVEKQTDAWEWVVSPVAQPGFAPHPAFVTNGIERSRIYVSAYLGAEASAKLVSVTGVLPQYDKTRAQFRTLGRARGTGWGIMDFAAYSALQLLLLVMTANFDTQTVVGKGIAEMYYDASCVATVAESSVNRIVVANAKSTGFVAGYRMGIGTSLGGHQIAKYRLVTSVDVYDASNKAISFDGAAVNVALGNIAYVMPSNTGGADALGIHTGRAAGTDGKTEVSFFGIQGMWGNFWQFIDGWNMDTSYYPWVNDNPATYEDAKFASPYKRVEAVIPSAADGYVRRFGFDPANPWSMMTGEVGGASSGPVGDYFYRSATPSERVLLVGGHWVSGSVDGPWYWAVNSASSTASWSCGARLLYKPG